MTLNSKRALTVAIDTSTDMLVCALRWADPATGEEQVLSRDHMCRRHANVELVNTVQSALAEAGFGIADVDTFVVGRGPGSFTGVRIGISTAKGLACGANVPLLGASTLDACAWTAWRAGERGLVGVATQFTVLVAPGVCLAVTDHGVICRLLVPGIERLGGRSVLPVCCRIFIRSTGEGCFVLRRIRRVSVFAHPIGCVIRHVPGRAILCTGCISHLGSRLLSLQRSSIDSHRLQERRRTQHVGESNSSSCFD